MVSGTECPTAARLDWYSREGEQRGGSSSEADMARDLADSAWPLGLEQGERWLYDGSATVQCLPGESTEMRRVQDQARKSSQGVRMRWVRMRTSEVYGQAQAWLQNSTGRDQGWGPEFKCSSWVKEGLTKLLTALFTAARLLTEWLHYIRAGLEHRQPSPSEGFETLDSYSSAKGVNLRVPWDYKVWLLLAVAGRFVQGL